MVYLNQKSAFEETLFQIVLISSIFFIQECWPGHLCYDVAIRAIPNSRFDPNEQSVSRNLEYNMTYTGFCQSSSVGQRSLPQASWTNPRWCLSSRSTGGLGLDSRLIQSGTRLLSFEVSSPRALSAPCLSWTMVQYEVNDSYD